MGLLTELKHKKIVVLGVGLTGLSCVRFLHGQGLSLTVNDSRVMPFSNKAQQDEFLANYSQVNLVTGYWDEESIRAADMVVASPGIDLVASGLTEFISTDCQVLGDVELFCQVNNQRINPISLLAVTGSNGKSTVVSLLAYLAKVLGVNAGLGGNIGQGVLDFLVLEQATNTQMANQVDLLILELSSFQLETLRSMQAIAASVLNVSDDHLDRHKTFSRYQKIKQSIYQQSNVAVVNRDDQSTQTHVVAQKIISFGSDPAKRGHFGLDVVNNKIQLMFGEQALITLEQLPLAGIHNALNYLSALALGYSAGWSLHAMVENLAGFSGLAHRCQRVKTNDNVQWINDSKATNVGATLAAISGLSSTLLPSAKLFLIAGGEGKGADFSPLKVCLNKSVAELITIGKDGDKIAALITSDHQASPAHQVSSMKAAVETANRLAQAGDMVLLSPACASLDMFKNFIDRGEQFIQCIEQVQVKTLAEDAL